MATQTKTETAAAAKQLSPAELAAELMQLGERIGGRYGNTDAKRKLEKARAALAEAQLEVDREGQKALRILRAKSVEEAKAIAAEKWFDPDLKRLCQRVSGWKPLVEKGGDDKAIATVLSAWPESRKWDGGGYAKTAAARGYNKADVKSLLVWIGAPGRHDDTPTLAGDKVIAEVRRVMKIGKPAPAPKPAAAAAKGQAKPKAKPKAAAKPAVKDDGDDDEGAGAAAPAATTKVTPRLGAAFRKQTWGQWASTARGINNGPKDLPASQADAAKSHPAWVLAFQDGRAPSVARDNLGVYRTRAEEAAAAGPDAAAVAAGAAYGKEVAAAKSAAVPASAKVAARPARPARLEFREGERAVHVTAGPGLLKANTHGRDAVMFQPDAEGRPAGLVDPDDLAVEWKIGDRAEHATFGPGVVRSVVGELAAFQLDTPIKIAGKTSTRIDVELDDLCRAGGGRRWQIGDRAVHATLGEGKVCSAHSSAISFRPDNEVLGSGRPLTVKPEDLREPATGAGQSVFAEEPRGRETYYAAEWNLTRAQVEAASVVGRVPCGLGKQEGVPDVPAFLMDGRLWVVTSISYPQPPAAVYAVAVPVLDPLSPGAPTSPERGGFGGRLVRVDGRELVTCHGDRKVHVEMPEPPADDAPPPLSLAEPPAVSAKVLCWAPVVLSSRVADRLLAKGEVPGLLETPQGGGLPVGVARGAYVVIAEVKHNAKPASYTCRRAVPAAEWTGGTETVAARKAKTPRGGAIELFGVMVTDVGDTEDEYVLTGDVIKVTV